ncbi:hypothetical protein A6R68_16392, partial [Neotoma lepida]
LNLNVSQADFSVEQDSVHCLLSSVMGRMTVEIILMNLTVVGQFKCTKNQKCIPVNLRCNGQDDCGDEEDERDC